MALSRMQETEDSEEMFCEVCREKGRSRVAEGFCVNCVKYFCSDCIEYHSTFLPNHVQKDRSSMPRNFCFKPCSAHEAEIIKFFCKNCNTFFCELCRKENHRLCPRGIFSSKVKHLPTYVEKIDLNEKYENIGKKLEKELAKIHEEETRVNGQDNPAKERAAKARQKLALQRAKVQAWLDSKYRKLEQEINDLENENTKLIQSDISELKHSERELQALATELQGTQETRSRCEQFMSLHLIEKKIERHGCPWIKWESTIGFSFRENDDLGKTLQGLSIGGVHRMPDVQRQLQSFMSGLTK